MFVSTVPLVVPGQRDPLVLRVRMVLNMNGSDELDHQLASVIRGIQISRGMRATGWLDEPTLAALDMVAY